MLSIGLWRRYINITITILDNIHRSLFYLKHTVSETGFRLRLQEEPNQMGPTERASLCLHAAGQKAVGSIPDEITEFCSWPNIFSHTKVLWSTWSLNINVYKESSWAKGGAGA
jgi:hypothetical protein